MHTGGGYGNAETQETCGDDHNTESEWSTENTCMCMFHELGIMGLEVIMICENISMMWMDVCVATKDNKYASLWQIAIEIHSEDLLTLPAKKHLSYLQDKYNVLRAIEVWTMFLYSYFRT